MNSKLGYTWYPKDWAFSEAVFDLNLSERGLYRELIDLAMHKEKGVKLNIQTWARKWNSSKEEIAEILGKLENLELIKVKGEKITVPSCDKRLKRLTASRENGKLGGRPKKKPTEKPSNKPTRKGKEKVKVKTKEERKRDAQKKFREWLQPYAGSYGMEMLKDFFMYWTEAGPDDALLRYQKQTSFDIGRRLSTWAKRDRGQQSKTTGLKI